MRLKREDFRVWTIPSGRIEAREAAAHREALEETGFTAALLAGHRYLDWRANPQSTQSFARKVDLM